MSRLSLGSGLGSQGGAGGFRLDFTGGALPSGVTLTRASTGTRFNISGVLVTAAINAARFDYNPVSLASRGILIEPAGTNLALRSEELDNVVWVNAGTTITANNIAAPDGTTTAERQIEDASNGRHGFFQTIAATGSNTLTAFAKIYAGTRFIRLAIADGSNTNFVYAAFNIANGTITQTGNAGTGASAASSIQDCGGGWYRLVVSGNVTTIQFATISSHQTGTDAAGTDYGYTTYTGDATSGCYLWGEQFEAGAIETSYTPTVAASVTRSADVASFTIPAGVGTLIYTFDNDTTQNVAVAAGAYTIPTTLNRPRIKTIVGTA